MSDRLNPFVFDGQWGQVVVGGVTLPGVVTSIDGANKPEEWNVQKGTGSSGATTVWKGTKLAEDIKIAIALHDGVSFDDYYTLRDTLRPKLGKKPPSLSIVSPVINFNGITRVACKDISAPKWEPSGGYWTGEISLIEYNPSKPTNTGRASAASPAGGAAGAGGAGGAETENDRLAKQLQGAMDEASKL
jgi:hypothetical protein